MFKGCARHTTIKRQANVISGIQLRRAYDDHVGGPSGSNISDSPRGVMAPFLIDLFWLKIFQVVSAAFGVN